MTDPAKWPWCPFRWESDFLHHRCSLQAGHENFHICHCGATAENPGGGSGRGEGGVVSNPGTKKWETRVKEILAEPNKEQSDGEQPG